MLTALAVDARTEHFVPDLSGLTFLDAAGARALTMATHFPPSGCTVCICSLSSRARRVKRSRLQEQPRLLRAGQLNQSQCP